MLRIIPVYLRTQIDLSLVGEERLVNLPSGLRNMFRLALEEIDSYFETKPHTLYFDDPKGNDEFRAHQGLLQFKEGSEPLKNCQKPSLIAAWTSFLQWHGWWSKTHWENRISHDADYHAKCTDCGIVAQSKDAWPEKCTNGDCQSHLRWHTVNGVEAS
ncbi:MAG: hypothetical protein Q7R63_01155 [bacterium]|nr:hypothetical protein [bacterium]